MVFIRLIHRVIKIHDTLFYFVLFLLPYSPVPAQVSSQHHNLTVPIFCDSTLNSFLNFLHFNHSVYRFPYRSVRLPCRIPSLLCPHKENINSLSFFYPHPPYHIRSPSVFLTHVSPLHPGLTYPIPSGNLPQTENETLGNFPKLVSWL